MDPTIFAAICSACAGVIGALLAYIASKYKADKEAATEANSIEDQNKLLVYKVDELIKDVRSMMQKLDENKNELVELSFRFAALEEKQKTLEKRVDVLEKPTP